MARSRPTPPAGWACSWSAGSPCGTASRSSSTTTTGWASPPPCSCRPASCPTPLGWRPARAAPRSSSWVRPRPSTPTTTRYAGSRRERRRRRRGGRLPSARAGARAGPRLRPDHGGDQRLRPAAASSRRLGCRQRHRAGVDGWRLLRPGRARRGRVAERRRRGRGRRRRRRRGRDRRGRGGRRARGGGARADRARPGRRGSHETDEETDEDVERRGRGRGVDEVEAWRPSEAGRPTRSRREVEVAEAEVDEVGAEEPRRRGRRAEDVDEADESRTPTGRGRGRDDQDEADEPRRGPPGPGARHPRAGAVGAVRRPGGDGRLHGNGNGNGQRQRERQRQREGSRPGCTAWPPPPATQRQRGDRLREEPLRRRSTSWAAPPRRRRATERPARPR